jgi:Ca2+-binding RTX toxin-like protein
MIRIVPVLLAVTAAAAAAVPPGASAATLERTASIGTASEDLLIYRAGRGERNRVTVVDDAKKGIVFIDPGARIRRRPRDLGGCKFSRGGHRATCDLDRRTDVSLRLGDADDSVRFRGGNAGPLGQTARTDVKDAAKLGDFYFEDEGANAFHAVIVGGAGDDVLRGTDGLDYLAPGAGSDRVDGGRGRDVIEIAPDGVPDVVRGGAGLDEADGAGRKPLTIDLEKGTLDARGDADTLESIERARGGSGDDMLLGSDGPDGLFGDLGSDTVDGRGGPDYLGGDLPEPAYGAVGKPGVDTLTGGPGDDVLDGREDQGALTPTDQLVCGDGAHDRIVASQDDLADPSCERSAFGVFVGDLEFDQDVTFRDLSTVAPVAQGPDYAPTYRIACYGGFSGEGSCSGRVQLEMPPVTGDEKDPVVLGTSEQVTIKGRSTKDVPVALNDAGKAALAQPGARVSVHVDMGSTANFGWQQVLGPP